MIIVCGPDNSGKTTLVDGICKTFPLLKRFKSPGPSASYDWWMEMLTQDPETLALSIFDRFLFSEYVYGPLCRDQIRLTDHQREVVESQLLTAEPLIVLCELIPQKPLFDERPQEFGWDVQLMANKIYPDIFEDHWRVWGYDANLGHDYTHAIDRVVEPYLKMMSEWYQRRTILDHGRGNITDPTWMFVGQQLANHNKWRVPFERSRSAQVLHHAIRMLKIPFEEIWFTNAYKSDEGLTTRNIADLRLELEYLKPTFVVAVGSKAAGLLNVLGREFVQVTHPAYYLRKGYDFNTLGDDYTRLLGSSVEHWL